PHGRQFVRYCGRSHGKDGMREVNPAPAIRAAGPVIHVRRLRDPTQTSGVRKAFEAEVRRRFEGVRVEVEKAIEGGALEAHEIAGSLHANAPRVHADGSGFGADAYDAGGRFLFPRSGENAAQFMLWLRELASRRVLGIRLGTDVREASRRAWSNVYIDTAYSRGIRQAGANLKRAGAKVAPSWVSDAFNRPIHADRVGLVY